MQFGDEDNVSDCKMTLSFLLRFDCYFFQRRYWSSMLHGKRPPKEILKPPKGRIIIKL